MPDEMRHATVAFDQRRGEQQRIKHVENVIADQDHPPPLLQQGAEPFQVQHPMLVIARQQVRVREERPDEWVVLVQLDPPPGFVLRVGIAELSCRSMTPRKRKRPKTQNEETRCGLQHNWLPEPSPTAQRTAHRFGGWSQQGYALRIDPLNLSG